MLVRRVMEDHGFSAAGEKVVVSWCCHEVTPVLQRGPMCGLVGLTMAAQLLHKEKLPLDSVKSSDQLHPERILQFAVGRGLSKQGEMFSTAAMEDVITNHLHLQSHTVDVDSCNTVEEMLVEKAILVPYDADKDHTPCLARGHSAHWCLLVGLCLVLEYPTEGGVTPPRASSLLECCHPLNSNPAHYVVSEIQRLEFAELLKTFEAVGGLLDRNRIYVFARHGKSSHLGLWSLRDLLESNRNLVEVDPRRSNPQEYVIPAGGLKQGLKNKVIFVTKR